MLTALTPPNSSATLDAIDPNGSFLSESFRHKRCRPVVEHDALQSISKGSLNA